MKKSKADNSILQREYKLVYGLLDFSLLLHLHGSTDTLVKDIMYYFWICNITKTCKEN